MFPSLWADDAHEMAQKVVIRQGISSISCAEAYALIESGSCTLLDVREKAEYDERHIPSAINFPVDTINAETASKILPDKNAVIVIYCLAGMRAASACIKLSDLGYRRLVNMGGISHWPYSTEQSKSN